MADVFISYSKANIAVMEQVKARLIANGISVWVDKQDLLVGAEWPARLEAGILASDGIVVIMSPDAKQSREVGRELAIADRSDRKLYPILVNGNEDTSVPYQCSGLQYIDLRRDLEIGLNQLVGKLRQDGISIAIRSWDPWIDHSSHEKFNAILGRAQEQIFLITGPEIGSPHFEAISRRLGTCTQIRWENFDAWYSGQKPTDGKEMYLFAGFPRTPEFVIAAAKLGKTKKLEGSIPAIGRYSEEELTFYAFLPFDKASGMTQKEFDKTVLEMGMRVLRFFPDRQFATTADDKPILALEQEARQ